MATEEQVEFIKKNNKGCILSKYKLEDMPEKEAEALIKQIKGDEKNNE